MEEVQERIASVLRSFSWSNFGYDEVEIGLHDYPEYQEWVDELALAIKEVL